MFLSRKRGLLGSYNSGSPHFRTIKLYAAISRYMSTIDTYNNIPGVTALSGHASNLFHMPKVQQKSSVTPKVLIICQKHLASW